MDTSEPRVGHKKRKRHRKRHLFNTILKQMEFYFSDAALTKDRMLRQMIDKDPFVPLEVFLTFNKIKILTSKVSDIVSALQNSKTLELSDDRLKVRRLTPLTPYDADSRTIYVESLPYTANIDWIINIFQVYGPVAYVSLPKYYNSNRIKGFAFVEFDKSEDAKKCLDAFIEMGCKMQTNIKAETLASCQGFQANMAEANTSEDKQEVKEEPPAKKMKKENEDECDVDGYIHSKNETAEESATEHSESANEQENCRSDITRGNASRKRKKDKQKAPKEPEKKNPDVSVKKLQILPKSEWKVLRNKYLDLQRKHMKCLKKALKTQHTVPEDRGHVTPNISGTGASESREEGNKINHKLKEISFVEGVVVKVQLDAPCSDVKEFKKATKQNMNVLFVDIKESDSKAYIRMKSHEAAKEFASSGIFNEADILKDKEEADYWELIKKNQYEKATSKRKVRGRDKLINKATQLVESINKNGSLPTKHIRFDE